MTSYVRYGSMQAKSVIKKLRCVKCGHEWFPRFVELPKQCPVCKRICYLTGKGRSREERGSDSQGKKSSADHVKGSILVWPYLA